MKFNHIGIFVKSLTYGLKELRKIIKIKKKSKIIKDETLKVKLIFIFDENNLCYELIEPYGKNNPVSNSIKKKYNLLNHLAYESINFDKDVKKLIKNGFRPISKPMPAKAFKGKKVIFLINQLNYINEIIEN